MATFEDYYPAPVSGGGGLDWVESILTSGEGIGANLSFPKEFDVTSLGTSAYGSTLYPADRYLMPNDVTTSIMVHDYNKDVEAGWTYINDVTNYDDEASFIADFPNNQAGFWRYDSFVDDTHGTVLAKTIADNYNGEGVAGIVIPVVITDFPEPLHINIMQLYLYHNDGTRAANWERVDILADGASATGYYMWVSGYGDNGDSDHALIAAEFNANTIVGVIPGWYATQSWVENLSATKELIVKAGVTRATTFYP